MGGSHGTRGDEQDGRINGARRVRVRIRTYVRARESAQAPFSPKWNSSMTELEREKGNSDRKGEGNETRGKAKDEERRRRRRCRWGERRRKKRRKREGEGKREEERGSDEVGECGVGKDGREEGGERGGPRRCLLNY